MKGSFFIGRVFGIAISLHWSFFLLLVYVFSSAFFRDGNMQGAFLILLLTLAVFFCVTLHELGHALAAQRYGIQTKSIVLLPIGGLATLEKMPEKPIREIVVAFAGPFVNLLLAIGLILGMAATDRLADLGDEKFRTLPVTRDNFLVLLLISNIALFVFNLVPAFPMDGGRIFRATLGFFTNRVNATRIAKIVGQLFAVGFVISGFLIGDYLLALIGFFIFLGAQAEFDQVRSHHLLEGFRVGDITMKEFTVFHPYQPLSDAVKKLLNSQEQNFLVIRESVLEGVLTKKDIISGLSDSGQDSMISKAMTAKSNLVIDINDTVENALELFQRTGVPIVAVSDAGRIVGVLDLENVNEFLLVRAATGTTIN